MPKVRIMLIAWLFAVSVIVFLPPAAWSETERLNTSEDWQSFRFVDKSQKTCYAISKPTVSEGKYTKRGDVLVFVSHFVDKDPNSSIYDQVSIEMGYAVKRETDVTLLVDNNKYILKNSAHDDDQSTVYASLKDEKKLITAFKKGYTFEVHGVSSRNTKTHDKFSLRGFAKAYGAIQKGCRE